MASPGELRIGKGWIGAGATVIGAILVVAASSASQLSSRVGGLERQYAAIEVKQSSLEKQLDYMTVILEKLRDR